MKEIVREFYGSIARSAGNPESGDPAVRDPATQQQGCCAPSCCAPDPSQISDLVGYTAEQLASIPREADLGLGCGNPTAHAQLDAGETVVDLGSGAGIDAFLAAKQVGDTGRVIGVDMTADMIDRARAAKAAHDIDNVTFRLGEIEHLPIADNTADVVISNCVVNLSPDKPAVFRDVFRILKPGGRVAISDIVATAEIPAAVREEFAALVGCVGNAEHVDVIVETLEAAGFVDIEVQPRQESATLIDAWVEGASNFAASATIHARKPV